MMRIAHKLVITTFGYLRTTSSCKGVFFTKHLNETWRKVGEVCEW